MKGFANAFARDKPSAHVREKPPEISGTFRLVKADNLPQFARAAFASELNNWSVWYNN